jgi:hypothetical protein
MNTALCVEDWLFNLLDKNACKQMQVRNILTSMSSLEVKAANARRSAKQNPVVRYLLS